MLRRAPAGKNARVAAWSVLVLLATAAVEPLVDAARQDDAASVSSGPVRATLAATTLTLHLPLPYGSMKLDPDTLRLIVGDGPPAAPVAVAATDPRSMLLRVAFAEGAGSEDAARVHGPGIRLDVQVATPPDTLPAPRFAAGVAVADGIAFVVGGATRFALARDEWLPLDTILRVDLGTGGIQTMGARLPTPRHGAAVFWDPRPTSSCPAGCAYAVGGTGVDGSALDEIVRFDPARDEATTLDARLPHATSGAVALWTGEHALVLGGRRVEILRVDPLAESVTIAGASALAAADRMAAVFVPRPSAACPAGCGYLFGGAYPADATGAESRIALALDQARPTVLRLDVATASLAPMPARLPQPRAGAAAVWDGERALVVGGVGCVGMVVCDTPRTVLAFDPLSGSFTELPTRLETPARDVVAAWGEGEIVLVAGVLGTVVAGEAMASIVRVDAKR